VYIYVNDMYSAVVFLPQGDPSPCREPHSSQ